MLWHSFRRSLSALCRGMIERRTTHLVSGRGLWHSRLCWDTHEWSFRLFWSTPRRPRRIWSVSWTASRPPQSIGCRLSICSCSGYPPPCRGLQTAACIRAEQDEWALIHCKQYVTQFFTENSLKALYECSKISRGEVSPKGGLICLLRLCKATSIDSVVDVTAVTSKAHQS